MPSAIPTIKGTAEKKATLAGALYPAYSIPTFARIEVSAANTADNAANINHIKQYFANKFSLGYTIP